MKSLMDKPDRLRSAAEDGEGRWHFSFSTINADTIRCVRHVSHGERA